MSCRRTSCFGSPRTGYGWFPRCLVYAQGKLELFVRAVSDGGFAPAATAAQNENAPRTVAASRFRGQCRGLLQSEMFWYALRRGDCLNLRRAEPLLGSTDFLTEYGQGQRNVESQSDRESLFGILANLLNIHEHRNAAFLHRRVRSRGVGCVGPTRRRTFRPSPRTHG